MICLATTSDHCVCKDMPMQRGVDCPDHVIRFRDSGAPTGAAQDVRHSRPTTTLVAPSLASSLSATAVLAQLLDDVEPSGSTVRAAITEGNIASERLFEVTGFHRQSEIAN
jgi:hypothetical protein